MADERPNLNVPDDDSLPAQQPPEYHVMVLLVDDQAMVCEAVRRALASEPDIDFHYCADARDAMAVATQIRPTVILQDLVMPGIDGLTLVNQFRANPATREIPIIVLSTNENPQVKGQAFALIYADQSTAGGIVVDDKALGLLRTLRNQAVMAFRQAG